MSLPQERFSAALYHSSRVWRLALDRRLKHLGLGQAGWTTIAIVAKSEARLSQSELAQRVGVEGATMVATIDRLVKAGFVTRQVLESDRRVKQVALTEAGWAVYATVKAEAALFRQEMLVDVDEALLEQVATLLERLVERGEAVK